MGDSCFLRHQALLEWRMRRNSFGRSGFVDQMGGMDSTRENSLSERRRYGVHTTLLSKPLRLPISTVFLAFPFAVEFYKGIRLYFFPLPTGPSPIRSGVHVDKGELRAQKAANRTQTEPADWSSRRAAGVFICILNILPNNVDKTACLC